MTCLKYLIEFSKYTTTQSVMADKMSVVNKAYYSMKLVQSRLEEKNIHRQNQTEQTILQLYPKTLLQVKLKQCITVQCVCVYLLTDWVLTGHSGVRSGGEKGSMTGSRS